ncbi:ribokinase [Caballeronia ptereochthonis]|uniref:Ribokinase n=1 Tax=Caballeronia ptereochthonis TaxID=1777144 RepID=A0A158CE04_9BURK|nr:ribokinase [Caballeronia ptereochthonis]SAK80532.1 ribokinase [Caballeronia ptereochthonis]
MSGARVCVVGNAAVDLTLRVASLPKPGETSLALGSMLDFGGKGANQAVIAARAGAEVTLLAAVGSDADGARIVAMLEAEGIDTRHIAQLDCATDLSIVTVDAAGENTIVTRNDAASAYAPDAAALDAVSAAGDWIVLQGNLSRAVTATLLREARRGNRHTLLNPGPVQFDVKPLLPDVDVLVVNGVEAAALSGEPDPRRAARSLHADGATDVLVTLGANGVVWCRGEGRVDHVPALAVTAVDTVGAGDALCGTLVAGFARGLPLRDVLPHAMSVAAFVVGRHGTRASFPDRRRMRELARFI